MAIIKIYNESTGEYDELPVARGESSYEIAVRNGFDGTEEEWLETLKNKIDDSQISTNTTWSSEKIKESESKYAKALQIQVINEKNTQIYAENDVVNDLVINGVELIQVVTENSPSLDNPSEIQISSEQNMQICQMNLFNGIIYGNTPNSRTITTSFIMFDSTRDLKIVGLPNKSIFEGSGYKALQLYTDKNTQIKVITTSNDNITINSSEIPEEAKYLKIVTSSRFITEEEMNNYISSNKLFVHQSTNEEEYQGYNGVNITIPLINSAIGQYVDTIDRENNLQNKVIQELILTGDEDWTMAYGDGMFGLENSEIKFNINSKIALSNYFKFNSTTSNIYNTLLDNEFAFQFSDGKQKCFIKCIQFNSVTDWKAKLQELYQAGTPVKIYYVAENPTINPLPQEVQTALSNFKLYQDLNNIAIDSGSMSFVYNKSLSKTIKEMQDEIQEKDASIQNLTERVEALEKA